MSSSKTGVDQQAADAAGQAFFTVHSGLPREAPGSRDSTARALALTGELPAVPTVLDLGCGPGMQTLDLAAMLPTADITGIDLHVPFVDEANTRFAAAGISERVRARRGDMAALEVAPASISLIWSEGAVYNVGVSRALAAWQDLLAPGGWVAFTDAVWLEPNPPAELELWWRSGYPDMVDRDGQIDRVRAAGYHVSGEFVLPESAWWDDYYLPMAARIETLRPGWRDDPVGSEVLADCEREIDFYRRYARYYGYQFVIAKR